ncbi:MAG: hypothetical protein ACYTAF_01115 [Planctomycetota bacterium]|jgi:hypothetical protein
MSILDWLGKKKKTLKLEDVKREEIKLGIREQQTINKLEKMDKEREEVFARGAKVKSPSRRRQLARLYDSKSGGVKLLERELSVLSKELTTISALKIVLERRELKKDGIQKLLNRVREAELMTMLENEKITDEMYLEKLDTVLSTVTEGAAEVIEDLGREGSEVMQVWQKMDDGEIESLDDALKIADQAVRDKEEKEPELEAE